MLEKEAELALTNNELAELEDYQVNSILFVDLELFQLKNNCILPSRKPAFYRFHMPYANGA